MGQITYEQFLDWCKYWGYTIEEGFTAMCFAGNIIGQYYGNCVDYARETNHSNHSDAFKSLAEKNKEEAMWLTLFYSRLENAIYNMLEKHNKE